LTSDRLAEIRTRAEGGHGDLACDCPQVRGRQQHHDWCVHHPHWMAARQEVARLRQALVNARAHPCCSRPLDEYPCSTMEDIDEALAPSPVAATPPERSAE
jgi:hypothetical protein